MVERAGDGRVDSLRVWSTESSGERPTSPRHSIDANPGRWGGNRGVRDPRAVRRVYGSTESQKEIKRTRRRASAFSNAAFFAASFAAAACGAINQ